MNAWLALLGVIVLYAGCAALAWALVALAFGTFR